MYIVLHIYESLYDIIACIIDCSFAVDRIHIIQQMPCATSRNIFKAAMCSILTLYALYK